MEQSSARTTARLSVLYFFIYCPLGALCPLISQYLTSIGFNGTQIGLITSFGTATAFFQACFGVTSMQTAGINDGSWRECVLQLQYWH